MPTDHLTLTFAALADPTRLKAVADWAERYRHLWEGRLNRLDDYLHELQAKEKPHVRKPRSRQ